MKQEKGVITLYVLVVCLFVLIVGGIVYIGTSNKQSAQLAALKKIEENYNNTSLDAEDLYKNYEGGDVVPVFTPEQFTMVGTGETGYVPETGKIYAYTTDKTYMFYGTSEDITDVITAKVEEIVASKGYATEDKVEEIVGNNSIDQMYPIGSIYISTTETNPADYFGGTWEAYGQGRTIIGAGTGTDTNSTSQTFAAGSTGGEYKHTLTIAEAPSHTHTRGTMNITGSFTGLPSHGSFPQTGAFSPVVLTSMTTIGFDSTNLYYGKPTRTEFDASKTWSGATSPSGGDGAHNNVQPYITCYIWKRTA